MVLSRELAELQGRRLARAALIRSTAPNDEDAPVRSPSCADRGLLHRTRASSTRPVSPPAFGSASEPMATLTLAFNVDAKEFRHD